MLIEIVCEEWAGHVYMLTLPVPHVIKNGSPVSEPKFIIDKFPKAINELYSVPTQLYTAPSQDT